MKNEETPFLPRTKMFARRIVRLYCSLAKNDALAQILGKQVLRAGVSVGANYREASRARSKAEFISKMGDCLKEADETLYWLDPLMDEKVVSEKKLGLLAMEANELVSIFITILKKVRGHGG